MSTFVTLIHCVEGKKTEEKPCAECDHVVPELQACTYCIFRNLSESVEFACWTL